MKKQIGKKIIITIGLIFISAQFIYPLTIHAEVKLNWENPNQGKNPYKFKISDYLNSQLAMQVVGCTGIVNKVSGSIANLMSGDVSDIKWIWASKKEKALEQMCVRMNLALATGSATIINTTLSNTPKTVAEYCATKKTANKELENSAKESIKIEKGNQLREECLNGIAYTLARNQLTTMTKQTMNWVTSGFNGDPMYVRNINNFLSSVEDEVIYQSLNNIKNLDGSYNTKDYPYGKDFSTSLIKSRQSSQNFAESSKQDLTNYLTDGASIEDFANDFSKGGWAGWLALTQHPQNSPIGYTMIASQDVADKMTKETENVKAEKAENNGILSDKKCVVKAATKQAGKIEVEKAQAANALATARANYQEAQTLWLKATNKEIFYSDYIDAQDKLAAAEQKFKDVDASIKDLDEECAEWEVVTPGSLIGDKISYYLNSPERQLEMADNINEVLSVLFAQLINKLRLDGLTSLNSETFNNNSGGIGSNSWSTPINYTDTEGNKYSGSGLDESRAFDLTKDLGNIYNRADVKKLGTWDASTNTTYAMDGKKSLPLVPGKGDANTYYDVKVAGDTKLFADGYNVWEVGDRAFFDGTTWQNWKKGTNSPIAKRGIIQIQQDYIVVAKELLKVMPGVMPALGELDYCIPGPNPNWQANSGEAYEAFSEYVSGIEAVYSPSGIPDSKKENKERVNITNPSEDPTGQIFKNYRNIFKYNDKPNVLNLRWFNVENTSIYSYIKVLSNSSYDNDAVGDWIKEDKMADARDEVSELIQNIFDSLDIFDKEYPKTMSETYGTIQQEYLTREDKIIDLVKDKNTAYIPMAKDGLTLTKKMISYDEEIVDANADLKDSINETDSVVNKLELIKGQVGAIIKKAQDRRDAKITQVLNDNPYNKNYKTNTAYKVDYKQCLDEENIDYLDYTKIEIKEENRCGDKLDNDFDGLVDEQDTDCTSESERSRATGGTRSNGSGGVGTGGSPYDNNSESTKDYSREANAY